MSEASIPQPNPGDQNPWEDALKEANVPKINELSIGNVLNYGEKMLKRFHETHQGWGREDVVNLIKQDTGFQEPIIRGG